MLMRLIYFSRNRLSDWYGNKDLGVAEILASSVANNLRDCITGALICDDRWFVQALEGDESKISAAFERILRDQRHCDVALVTMQAITERRFPHFAMACVCRDEDNRALFRHYADAEGFDPRQMRPDRLSDLLAAVVGNGATGGPPWMKKRSTNAA